MKEFLIINDLGISTLWSKLGFGAKFKFEYELKSMCHRYLKNQTKSKILKFPQSREISIIYGIITFLFVLISCWWIMLYHLHILCIFCVKVID